MSSGKFRQKAREFTIWRALRFGAQTHEEVAERTALPLNEVKGTIRRKGWLFPELPAQPIEEVDTLPPREVFYDPPWEADQ